MKGKNDTRRRLRLCTNVLECNFVSVLRLQGGQGSVTFSISVYIEQLVPVHTRLNGTWLCLRGILDFVCNF